ncbi:MAG: GNAT family N-acetyltransferase [Ferruginibacter sp.]
MMIRKITAADFDFIFGMYMHPAINPYLLYELMDAAAFKTIYNELLQKDIMYIFEADGKPVGMFKFIPQVHRNSHIAYLGSVAILPVIAGQGYGKQMLREIIELGRRHGILRIELSTATFNDRAIKLYEQTGFVKEGVMRKYTYLKSEKRYVDEYLMSYLY